MISFDTWLPQIVGYCKFITDEAGLTRAWVNRDYSHTSVTDFDELYEQIFDDLDSDACEMDLIANLPDDMVGRDAISAFLKTLREFNLHVERVDCSKQLERILLSKEWRRVVVSAELVLSRFGNNDPTQCQ